MRVGTETEARTEDQTTGIVHFGVNGSGIEIEAQTQRKNYPLAWTLTWTLTKIAVITLTAIINSKREILHRQWKDD